MKASQKFIVGILAGFAFALIDTFLIDDGPIGTAISLGSAALVLVYGVIRGQKTAIWLRAFASFLILFWAYGTCLAGRTTGPGLTTATFGMSILTFFLCGLWPGFALLRLWPLRQGAILFIALFPLAFVLAASTASIEEYLFVKKYRATGVGTTKRWTVPNHWLAYDREHQRLDGSD